jgi:uncharacterized protein
MAMDDVVRIAAADDASADDRQNPTTIEDALRELAICYGRLPRSAMRWALDNWEIAGPRFLALLEAYVEGADRSERTEGILFFALHLFGEKRETAAFPNLCRLMRDCDGIENVLGDGTTETLKGIVISTFDGDVTALTGVIEAVEADEFVRDAALMAMAYLAHTGQLPGEDMRSYLLHLMAEMQPQASSFVWVSWVTAVAALGYVDFIGQVERLFRLGFVPREVMSFRHFKGDLERTLDDPNGMAMFAHELAVPFEDAIGTLSGWYAFSEERLQDEERRMANRSPSWLAPPEPRRNSLRHVGRNDPCPCGSGRKYKKCCLA